MMRTIWNSQGCTVMLTGVAAEVEDPAFEGIVRTWEERLLFQWSAVPTHQGYEVTLVSPAGRSSKYSGATWNLGLEVAAAVRRW